MGQDDYETIKLLRPDGTSCDLINTYEFIPYSGRRKGCVIRNPEAHTETGGRGYLKFPTYADSFDPINNELNYTRKNALPYGEVIAKRIADVVGIPACDADFGFVTGAKDTIPISVSYFNLQYSNKKQPDEDSHKVDEQKQPVEYLRTAKEIISLYLYTNDTFTINCEIFHRKADEYDISVGKLNNNIPLVLKAFEEYLTNITKLSKEKKDEVKQSIIDMIMFDCKFGNTDRHDENFGLAFMNDGSGSARFYPLFDNERLLGFWIHEKYIGHSNGRFEYIIPEEITSSLFFGHDFNKLHSIPETVRELFNRYPKEAKAAYEKVMQLTREDLEGLLDEYEDLSTGNPLRREFTLAVFDYLDRELGQIYEEAIDTRQPDSINSVGEGNGGETR